MPIDLPAASSRPLAQALGDLLASPLTSPLSSPLGLGSAGSPALPGADLAGAGSALRLSTLGLQLSQTSLAQTLSPTAASALATTLATAPSAWPSQGVDAPTQTLLNAVLAQLPTGSASPLQPLAAQAWPTALLQQLQVASTQPSGLPSPLAQALGELQTWLVQQGSLATTEGPRPYTLSLYVPASWLAGREAAPSQAARPQAARPQAASPQTDRTSPSPASASSLANQGPGAPLPLPPAAARVAALLESGVYALVLQEASERSSALLLLEFAPMRMAQVYGKATFNPVLDPWQQQAVLQASGERGDWAEQLASDHTLCDRPGCPYLGTAVCPQPFCPALGVVSPVGGAPAL